jgi:hypothetical protein
MRSIRLHSTALALSLASLLAFMACAIAPMAHAQTQISGDIAGNVMDSTGAVLANATVSVTSASTGQTKVVQTDSSGNFRVPLLAPGSYQVKIGAAGFETRTQSVVVAAGQVTTLNPRMRIGAAATTVEVTGDAIQTLDTENAQISTSFNLEQMQNLPNPGNDLTFVAQTTPGAVMNTQGGYGNFAMNGLPATSNTFTVNGGYEGDPYLNLNNSGATNLLLGNNDVEAVTITTNSYDAAFGGLGGAQVNEITRSGSSSYHGNLTYWWNGRLLNANDYFNKQFGSPRNFDNVNQWAAALGGPLKRDKIFGFIDTEGIRVIIPVRAPAYGPSPTFQSAVLSSTPICPAYDSQGNLLNPLPTCANLTYAPYGNLAYNGNSSEASLYQKIFSYYNNAHNWSQGSQDTADPRTWDFNGQTANLGTEWLINDRVDFNLGTNDHLFIHSKVDKGVQPTATSFLDPIFDALSPQPSYEGQLNETHTFSSSLTNQFLFAASYYRAIFTNTNAAQLAQTIPFVLIPEGFATGGAWDQSVNSGDWVGNIDYALPQGRNVTGYQFSDDMSWIRGNHNFKFGYAFRRDDITDYTTSEHNINFGGAENIIYDEGDFAAGLSDVYVERFPQRLSEPVALYVEGFYFQDQWKPVPNLTLTMGIRFEHDSNPICITNCVSNFSNSFSALPTSQSTPYNQIFASGRHQGLLGEQVIGYQPRFGFALLPFGSASKTTIRGGFGMFNDYFPAQIMGDLISNVPNVNRFTILGAIYGNPITVDTTSASSGHAQAVDSNNALNALFSKGGYYKNANGTCPDPLSIYCATNGNFSRPAVTATARHVSLPTYEEWSLAVEHQFLQNTTLAVTYVGNRSYHQPVSYMPNAYDTHAGTNASLPSKLPNAALGSVVEYNSGSWSNFNGLQAVLSSRIHWAMLQFNYVFGHALDTTSNGGFNAFGLNGNGQINPYNLAQNYGNADYDVRHYISANYDLAIPHYFGPKALVDNWEIAGTIFHNSGYPFSVTDNTGNNVYGNASLAKQIDNNFNHHCGGGSHTVSPCDFASHFTSSTDFGQQARNQLFGPNYTDFDLDLVKGFNLPKWETAKLKIGAQFFNLFNHPNFQLPDSDVNDPGVGLIYTQANTPTSILGAFLGGDAAPRLIQAKLSLTF